MEDRNEFYESIMRGLNEAVEFATSEMKHNQNASSAQITHIDSTPNYSDGKDTKRACRSTKRSLLV